MPKRYGNVYYLTGGVTQPDAQAMAFQYNLRVAFIAHTGQYLADVPVSIKNAHGNIVFDGVSEGPMLWVGVPPGRYVVTARHSGQPLVQQIEVGSHMRNPVYFRWQVPLVDPDF